MRNQPVAPTQPAPASFATTPQNARLANLLAWVTLAGVALYVAIDVALHLLPPHYNPILNPESDYARGPYGFLMTINFVVRGVFSLALLVGLLKMTTPSSRSRTGVVLLGVWSVGALLLAIFPTDAPGAHITLVGAVHLIVAIVAFLAIAAAAFVLALDFERDSRWAPFARLALILALATCAAALLLEVAPVVFHRLVNIGGLTERVFLGLAILWIAAVALRLLTIARQALLTTSQ